MMGESVVRPRSNSVNDIGRRMTSQSSVGSENASVFLDSPERAHISPRLRQTAISSPTAIELSSVSAEATAGATRRTILPSEGAAVCRICHGGEFSAPFTSKNAAGEPLISPCFCRGTMGLYHRTCVERWLGTSNRDRCEICKFLYVVERRPLPLLTYLRDPGSPVERRNLIGDMACWCVLTPLALISAYLCGHGAVMYAAQFGWIGVEVAGLFLLSFFLVVTYGVWLFVSIKYHLSTFREWQQTHQDVHVLDIDEVQLLKTSPVRIVLTTTSVASTNISMDNGDNGEARGGQEQMVHPTELSSRLLAGPVHASTPHFRRSSLGVAGRFAYAAGVSPNPIVTPNGSTIRFDTKPHLNSVPEYLETAV